MKKLVLLCILLLTINVFAVQDLSPKTPTTDTVNTVYEYPDITSFTDNDYIEYIWDEQTTIYPETEVFDYELNVKCVGNKNCATRDSTGTLSNGRIDTVFETDGSISEIDAETYHCAITNTQKVCTHTSKFKLYQGPIGPKRPTFSVKSYTVGGVFEDKLTNEIREIKVDYQIGTLSGTVSAPSNVEIGEDFDALVVFNCKDGICFDVKIYPDYGTAFSGEKDVFHCGNIDKENPCAHVFTVRSNRKGTNSLGAHASSYNPPETEVIAKKDTINSVNNLGIINSGPSTLPEVPREGNVFDVVWELIKGFF
jgi:hypothetical protein